MNSTELDVEMIRHGENGKILSDALGISQQTFSAKKNGEKAEFTQREIAIIQARYSLNSNRVMEIFFAEKVS